MTILDLITAAFSSCGASIASHFADLSFGEKCILREAIEMENK